MLLFKNQGEKFRKEECDFNTAESKRRPSLTFCCIESACLFTFLAVCPSWRVWSTYGTQPYLSLSSSHFFYFFPCDARKEINPHTLTSLYFLESWIWQDSLTTLPYPAWCITGRAFWYMNILQGRYALLKKAKSQKFTCKWFRRQISKTQ